MRRRRRAFDEDGLMDGFPRSLPPAALDWLEDLLHERLHPALRLVRGDDGAIELRNAHGAGRIRFAPLPAAADAPALPCTAWDPRSEGLDAVLDAPIPMPGLDAPPAPLLRWDADGCRFDFDLPALAYWALCRLEEIASDVRDAHQRFPGRASHAYRHGYLDRPIVDEWLDVLAQVAVRTWPALPPPVRAFALRVSHDVDIPSRYAFRSPRAALRAVAQDLVRRRVGHVARAPAIVLGSRQALHPGDPANTFDWIMDVSERHGLTSAFYFICGRTDARRDAGYDPEDAAIRRLLRTIHARGHEIGLHPSYATFRDPAAIAAEADRLRRVCREEGIEQAAWGGRMHYLRWEMPVTLRAWADAGMAYDSTLGYADMAGFRCGTCREYPAFDPVGQRRLPLRIRPLIAMECTVMDAVYMGLGQGEQALAEFLRLKRVCRAVGGTFTLLWHNSELDTPRLRELYAAVLAG